MKASSSSTVFCAAAGSSPRFGWSSRTSRQTSSADRPGRRGSTRAGGRFEIGLRFLQLALANRQQRRRRDIDQLLGAIPRLDVGRADRVRIGRVREHLRLEVRGVFVDGLARIVGRRRQAVLNCAIGDVGERQRQIAGHQVGGAAEHHDRALDEDPRRVAKVLARRREQPRHARQLRRRLPRPRRRRRRLHGHQVVDAIRDRRRVDHRVARPGADGVEIEQPAVDDALQNPAIDAFVRRQRQPDRPRRAGVETRAATRLPRQSPAPRSPRARVVRVNAVAGGNRGMVARELIEVFVDERGELRRGGCAARRRHAIAGESTTPTRPRLPPTPERVPTSQNLPRLQRLWIAGRGQTPLWHHSTPECRVAQPCIV